MCAARREIRRFHSDTGGQISLLMVFGAVVLVSLLGLVVTTGDQVDLKVQMQNSADAAALSGGAWIARGLNVTSAFNLIQTQLVAGALLLRGLDRALPSIHAVTRAQNLALKLCLPGCAPLKLITETQLSVLPRLRSVVELMVEHLANCRKGFFWIVAKGLEKINGAIHRELVRIAYRESRNIALLTGADRAYLIPGPVMNGKRKFTMPTREEPSSLHCDPMVHGSRSRKERGFHPLLGYPVGQGPFPIGRDRLKWVAMAVGGLYPATPSGIFRGFAEAERIGVCFGSTCGRRRPRPYLLDSRDDGLMYLAIASLDNRSLFFGGERVTSPNVTETYAQVEIYNGVNGTDPDAYTQDWRVRLAPASLFEKIFDSSGTPAHDAWLVHVDSDRFKNQNLLHLKEIQPAYPLIGNH